MGAPPNCKHECSISSECMSNKACIREKCIDPCPGSCGLSAVCSVISHTPICTCPDRYIGDPFTNCRPAPPPRKFCIYSAKKYYSTSAAVFYVQKMIPSWKILAILPHVDQMPNATAVYAHVYQNTRAIHIQAVAQSVY